jgi:hypothetical protein
MDHLARWSARRFPIKHCGLRSVRNICSRLLLALSEGISSVRGFAWVRPVLRAVGVAALALCSPFLYSDSNLPGLVRSTADDVRLRDLPSTDSPSRGYISRESLWRVEASRSITDERGFTREWWRVVCVEPPRTGWVASSLMVEETRLEETRPEPVASEEGKPSPDDQGPRIANVPVVKWFLIVGAVLGLMATSNQLRSYRLALKASQLSLEKTLRETQSRDAAARNVVEFPSPTGIRERLGIRTAQQSRRKTWVDTDDASTSARER